jgi:glycosyltransferase involved in cell wall biosynthesis
MAGCLGRTAALLAGVPVIVHTFHGNSLRHYFSPITNAVFLRIERLLARGTDAICVLSDQQANEINGEFGIGNRSRFHVVPLGLDLSPFLQVPARSAGDVLRIGWFGRLVPIKDVPLLVNVIAETLKTNQRVEFHVAGNGPDARLIEEACKRFGPAFTWHGWLSDITPVLAQCDILIQTSKNEGTPLALIQGMAAGRPFLSTAVGGVADMVTGPCEPGPGGRWFANGALVDPDAESFAAAIQHLTVRPDRLKAMSAAARNLAAVRYRQETLCASLDLIYRDLIEKKSARAQPLTISEDRVLQYQKRE